MFIRTTTKIYKGKKYKNYLLVKSVWTEKGPRQKTILSLGDLSPRPAKEWLKLAHKLEDALIAELELEERDEEVEEILKKIKERKEGKKSQKS